TWVHADGDPVYLAVEPDGFRGTLLAEWPGWGRRALPMSGHADDAGVAVFAVDRRSLSPRYPLPPEYFALVRSQDDPGSGALYRFWAKPPDGVPASVALSLGPDATWVARLASARLTPKQGGRFTALTPEKPPLF